MIVRATSVGAAMCSRGPKLSAILHFERLVCCKLRDQPNETHGLEKCGLSAVGSKEVLRAILQMDGITGDASCTGTGRDAILKDFIWGSLLLVSLVRDVVSPYLRDAGLLSEGAAD